MVSVVRKIPTAVRVAIGPRLLVLSLAVVLGSTRPGAGAEVDRGRVTDATSQPVAGARVVVVFADGSVEEHRSDAEGTFPLALSGELPARVSILAPGYAPFETELGDRETALRATLQPARLADSVTVTASRSETPASRSIQSVVLLPRADRDRAPALTLDDYLRKIPGFTLFRRSSSFVAHPTAQGVSLRGVGPSGASRSLVLADGVPLNDPFGGWVYWGRVPRAGLDRVEVLRGGASELYGTDALGGVIQLFRRPATSRTFGFEGYEGNLETRDYSVFASHRMGRYGAAVAGEYFRTGGYKLINPAERGPVDIEARSERHAVEASADVDLAPNARAFVVASEFSERRGNGTPLQNNDTQIRNLSAGSSFVAGGSQWGVQSFALGETFDALTSSISADRATESLTRSQRVPASSGGVLGTWRRAVGRKHLLLGGTDYIRVRGASDEIGFAGAGPTGTSRAEGRQERAGLYLQDLFQVTSRLDLVFGLRWDRWLNHDAYVFTHTLATGVRRQTPFESRSDDAWSPKVGGRLDLGHDVALRGALARAFRAPTLNELYRGFRVGNVVTRENPELGPEHATTWEVGADWRVRSDLAVRGTWFRDDIRNPIANVTLSSTPALITRQRQNLGSTRSRGLELDTAFRPGQFWSLTAGYFLADSTVRSAPASPDLVGLRVPLVSRHQGTLELAYQRGDRFSAVLLLRISGPQFDDDQNRLRLRSAEVLDFSAARRVARGVDLFFACENLLDQIYPVGRTPVESIGMPRRFHGGLRFRVE